MIITAELMICTYLQCEDSSQQVAQNDRVTALFKWANDCTDYVGDGLPVPQWAVERRFALAASRYGGHSHTVATCGVGHGEPATVLKTDAPA